MTEAANAGNLLAWQAVTAGAFFRVIFPVLPFL